MVEYFGEQLDGFGFGWVQSYGSRCVKPPIIFGDVSRRGPITVDWIRYAQSLTDKPVKGMLTGPATILNCWGDWRIAQRRRTYRRTQVQSPAMRCPRSPESCGWVVFGMRLSRSR